MATVTVNRDNPIKHHCQDHYNDCGRACAQMVITSFILGRGANPSTPLVTQKELQGLEQNPQDNNGWFTDPGELLRMLQTATELKPGSWQTEWHLGVYDTVEELLADILLALDAGRPSCITMQGRHWNVVTGASFGANKKLKSLWVLDPSPPAPKEHTYGDACTKAMNGEGYLGGPRPLEDLRNRSSGYSPNIAVIPVRIGKKVRQPLNAYDDKFVAVVHGVKPSTKAIRDKGRESMPKVIMGPSVAPVVPFGLAGVLVPVMDPSKLYTELNDKVTEWEVDGATELLAQKPPLNVRRVIDTDASSQYVLASLFDTTAQIGMLGMFAPDGELQQLRFFSDEGVHATLGEADDVLWWSARTLSPPYFPFAKEVDALGRVVGYSRVLDRYRVPAEKLEGPVR